MKLLIKKNNKIPFPMKKNDPSRKEIFDCDLLGVSLWGWRSFHVSVHEMGNGRMQNGIALALLLWCRQQTLPSICF
jgi:hypothetical protein